MKKKILIIDDNEQDLKSMTRFLNQEGYKDIIQAGTPDEGLKKCKQEKPDIVVVDTVLPGGDGFSLCSQIKNSSTNNAKVIILTGHLDAINSEKAILAGSDAYIVKTSDYALLIKTLKGFV